MMGVPPAVEARQITGGPSSSTVEPTENGPVSPLDRGGSRDGPPAISRPGTNRRSVNYIAAGAPQSDNVDVRGPSAGSTCVGGILPADRPEGVSGIPPGRPPRGPPEPEIVPDGRRVRHSNRKKLDGFESPRSTVRTARLAVRLRSSCGPDRKPCGPDHIIKIRTHQLIDGFKSHCFAVRTARPAVQLRSGCGSDRTTCGPDPRPSFAPWYGRRLSGQRRKGVPGVPGRVPHRVLRHWQRPRRSISRPQMTCEPATCPWEIRVPRGQHKLQVPLGVILSQPLLDSPKSPFTDSPHPPILWRSKFTEEVTTTTATGTDNTAAHSWPTKGAVSSTGPPSYLLRLKSIHQRAHCYQLRTFYILGPINKMADNCSRLWHLTDKELLEYFNRTYPQAVPWQIQDLSPAMHEALP
ncbi:hypothetical protein THAOC_28410 [Thalassiosira oceanica]|uniref:Uncharacterized protein n=1 Tax=Thalassiosira oceanica TaxID=159749 RepID=K0RF42_THAOC|nr:hypothetical protein THAOC_28410 [Thalassiosira oceanica]|eukprot:EJK52328.1 hypothetical protein THAOC_28410 [Thalassiosira oceanica]